MTDTSSNSDNSSAEKNPDDWTTGGETITEAQRSYIETMATESGEELPDLSKTTKADASKLIEKLQDKTGRGNS